jgi:hypothetical protein
MDSTGSIKLKRNDGKRHDVQTRCWLVQMRGAFSRELRSTMPQGENVKIGGKSASFRANLGTYKNILPTFLFFPSSTKKTEAQLHLLVLCYKLFLNTIVNLQNQISHAPIFDPYLAEPIPDISRAASTAPPRVHPAMIPVANGNE